MLAATAIGLGIWAFNAQSDADDAQAELATASQAANASTPEPTAVPTTASTPAPTTAPVEEVDPASTGTVRAGRGQPRRDRSESVDEIDQTLDQAATKVDSAEQARDNATGALDKARAEAEAIGARFELMRTCMQGTLSALGAAFESGGLEATVQQLQELSGSCASSESP